MNKKHDINDKKMNKTKKIFVFLFNGFSDWEISYLTPELQKSNQFDLIYFSNTEMKVLSMGGLQIIPTTIVSQINIHDIDMLILPGGTAWERGVNNELNPLINEIFNKGKTIAAICAATACLGQLGILDNLKHTSNDLNYIKYIAPQYSGDMNYQDDLAVTDKNIITAKGTAPIEFAREIFKTLSLYNDNGLEKWFQLFKHGIWSE